MEQANKKGFKSIFELREEIKPKKPANIEYWRTLLAAKQILSKLTIRPFFIIIPIILSFLSAMCEGLSLALLAPLAKGLLDKNFDFIQRVPVLGVVVEKISNLYDAAFFHTFTLIIIVIIFFAILKEVLHYASSIMITYRQGLLSTELKHKMMERYLGFGKFYFDRTMPGYIRTIIGFAKDVTGLLSMVNSVLNSIFTLGIYLIIMFKASWKISLFCLVLFPVMNFSVNWLIKRIHKTSKEAVKAFEELSVKVYTILSSMHLIKAYTREQPKPFSRINLEIDKPVSFALQCRHCEDAPCVNACLSGAMQKDEDSDLVIHNYEKCIGCWTCIMVCPFGAIKKDSSGKAVSKCDLCSESAEPACVANCPNRALIYKEVKK